MLIRKENQSALDFPKWYKDRFIKERTDYILSHKNLSLFEQTDAIYRVKKVTDDSDTKFYLPSKNVLDFAKKIKIDTDKFDVACMSVIKDKKVTFMLGDRWFRYYKQGHTIMVLAFCQRKVTEADKLLHGYGDDIELAIHYVYFSFDLMQGTCNWPSNLAGDFGDHTLIEFLQLILFTELTDTEMVILNPNQSHGTRKQGKVKNDSKSKVTIVDTSWNKIIIKDEEFWVEGHLRCQRCGKGNREIKIIPIMPFKKYGYVRGAKKEFSQM